MAVPTPSKYLQASHSSQMVGTALTLAGRWGWQEPRRKDLAAQETDMHSPGTAIFSSSGCPRWRPQYPFLGMKVLWSAGGSADCLYDPCWFSLLDWRSSFSPFCAFGYPTAQSHVSSRQARGLLKRRSIFPLPGRKSQPVPQSQTCTC